MSAGDLLRLAREAEGLTQQQVSERAGIPQPHVSKLERDWHEPRDEVLGRLAVALSVTPEFFRLQERFLGATAAPVHARRRKTSSPKLWRHLEARLNMHRIRVHRLLEHLDLELPNEIPRLGDEPIEPEEAAQMVRIQWRMPMGPVHDLVGWLESAGAIVIVEDFGTDRIDGLSQWFGAYPVFMVNERAPTDRVRLTLAHELGHLALHEEPHEFMEREADRFAAEFLMPGSEVKGALRRPTLSGLVPLKLEWMVSIQALIERAYALGTINSQRRTSLWKQLSGRGWRKREPVSDELPPERPRQLDRVIEALRSMGTQDAQLVEWACASTGTVMPGPSHLRTPTAPGGAGDGGSGLRLVR